MCRKPHHRAHLFQYRLCGVRYPSLPTLCFSPPTWYTMNVICNARRSHSNRRNVTYHVCFPIEAKLTSGYCASCCCRNVTFSGVMPSCIASPATTTMSLDIARSLSTDRLHSEQFADNTQPRASGLDYNNQQTLATTIITRSRALITTEQRHSLEEIDVVRAHCDHNTDRARKVCRSPCYVLVTCLVWVCQWQW